MSFTVTLVITTHREGTILQKTLKALPHLLERSKHADIDVTVMLIADRPDQETLRVIEQNRDVLSVIHQVEFGDLGDARNFGAMQAKTQYLTYLDGDDFYCADWVERCIRFAEGQGGLADVILRPQLIISFERAHDFWIQLGEDDPSFDYSCIIESNPWASVSFGETKTYRSCGYKNLRLGDTFGYEDWLWHTDLIAKGIKNHVVPGTAYFYRKKHAGSLAQERSNHISAIPRCNLFDRPELLLRKGPEASPRKWRSLALAVFPAWLTQEMRALSEFEYGLFPSRSQLSMYHPWLITGSEQAEPYAEAFSLIGGRQWNYAFFAPWLKRGGADLGTIHHINELVQSGKSVCLLTTENSDSPWLGRLDENVTVVELGRLCSGLSREAVMNIALRLMLQVAPERIHNINSWICWDLFKLHAKKLRKTTRLYASVFCEDYGGDEGIPGGYAVTHLESTWMSLDAIFSDNRSWPLRWQTQYAIPEDKFVTAYFPVAYQHTEGAQSTKSRSDSKKHVLWASRLDRQKQPEIVDALADLMPETIFHIFGDSILESEEHTFQRMKQRPNIVFHGAYDGLASTMAQGPYDAFLYTSLWDGIPNVLLESIALELPIVTSLVGGIKELLSDESAFIVRDERSIGEFRRALLNALTNSQSAHAKAARALELLQSRHNYEQFRAALATAPGYL